MKYEAASDALTNEYFRFYHLRIILCIYSLPFRIDAFYSEINSTIIYNLKIKTFVCVCAYYLGTAKIYYFIFFDTVRGVSH